MSNSKKHNKKMVIIGGGKSAAYVVQSLLKKNIAQHIDLTILSGAPKEKFGLGLAWDRNNVSSRHFVNMYTNRDDEDSQETNFPDIAQAQRKEMPRGEGGAIADEKIQQLFGVYRHVSKLDIRYGVYAEKIEKIGKDLRVRTDAGSTFDADFVVGCPGHWQHYELTQKNPGVYGSPWPASKFDDINYNQPILIQGSSLSGIDTVTTLSHNAGTFSDNIRFPHGVIMRKQEGNYGSFTPHAGNKNFRLDLYSRHGVLPSVLGYIDEKYIGTNKELQKHYRDTNLNDVFATLKRLFLTRPHETSETMGLVRILKETNSLDEALRVFEGEFKKLTPHERLAQELDDALKSFAEERALPVQQFFRAATNVVEDAYRYFSAEDQQRYMKDIHPFIARYAYGMMISNAQEVLSLMNAGRLDIHAVGFESSLGNKTDGDVTLPGAEINYTDYNGQIMSRHYNVVVNAMGDNMRLLKDSSPLMRDLFASGIAEEITFPYADAAQGCAALEKQVQNRSAEKYVFKRNGTYLYSAGGISLTPDWEVTSPLYPTDSNIFMVGPPAAGYTPLLQGFGAIVPQANSIADRIKTRLDFEDTSQEMFMDRGIINLHPADILQAARDAANNLIFVRTKGTEMVLVIGNFPADMEDTKIIEQYGDAIKSNGTNQTYGILSSATIPKSVLEQIYSKLDTPQI